MDGGDVEFSDAASDGKENTPIPDESVGKVENKAEYYEKVPEEEIHFRAENIQRQNNDEMFVKVEGGEKYKREMERREKAEQEKAKREAEKLEKDRLKAAKKESGLDPQKKPIGKKIAIIIVALVIIGGVIAGCVDIYEKFLKPKEVAVLSDEEKEKILEEIRLYYNNKTNEEIEKDAKKIYDYLGEKYNSYDDKDIKVASLEKRIELLGENDKYLEKVIKDAEEVEKYEKSIESASVLVDLYMRAGDNEKAMKYQEILNERNEEFEKGDTYGEG